MTGCYSLKTVSVQDIPKERNYLVVHAGDNYWTVEDHAISDSYFYARLSADTSLVSHKNTAHLYVAPIEVVSVGDQILSLPVANIGKADYREISIGQTAGAIAVWFLTIWTLLIFL
jgi:hypothetical protein